MIRIKNSFRVYSYINKEIKIGDNVKLNDGSAFTINEDKHPEEDEDYFIVSNYPERGFNSPLLSYLWKVVEINVKDRVASGALNNVYLQDIVIECNNVQFRTSSGMVNKV